jgi:hypothetical protein
MSDTCLVIIPKDPRQVPSEDAIASAKKLLASIVPEAGEISSDIAEGILFRDCGPDFESVSCPHCGTEVPFPTWAEWMSEDWADTTFQLQKRPLPCCGSEASLADLAYLPQQGLSRFEISAMNPNRGDLSPKETDQIEAALGCGIRVIYRRI